MSKLIILRGPSGAGKSTIVKNIRERCAGVDIALIDQDYYKLVMLATEDVDKRRPAVVEVCYQNALTALNHGYHVIMEGLFTKKTYLEMFEKLLAAHPQENYIYFLDISFDETVRRHATRAKSEEFGAELMKEWYQNMSPIGLPGEVVFGDEASLDDIVEKILSDTGLNN